MQIRKIQSLELKTAMELKRICEKHNIRYFLIGGTLLGAVRHGGFIPWDDDMDIGMLRPDYERFLKVCESDLSDEYLLQTWDTDPEFPMSYAKIRLKGTKCVEVFAENSRSENKGLFVDIFPFDNAPDDPRERQKQAWRYYFCKRLLWIKKGVGKSMMQESLRQRIRYCIFWLVSCLFRYKDVKRYFRKVQQKYNHLNTQNVVTDGAYSYHKECLRREWVTNLAPVDFESEIFMACQDRHAYLEHRYGDYMTPPPEEKRKGHSFASVDFGIYE